MKIEIKALHWRRWFFLRSEMDMILTASMLFSMLMVAFRLAYTHELIFISLIWNLFLAYIPYVLSRWALQRPGVSNDRWRLALIFIPWLLFIPNSFYIITDLFHLGESSLAPLWYDLALIYSFAWNGLLLGILSVRQMEKAVQPYLKGKSEWLFIVPVMWMNAWGVYIGRYLRFNSWDVITNPFGLAMDLLHMLLHPLQYKYAWGMIVCFSIFMSLIYISIKKLGKAAA